MATYYDGLNDFYKRNDIKPLASSAQLVYLHLLQLNNCHANCGVVQISDRDLGLRTSLSKNTITQAKRTLKNLGWIDFKTSKSPSGTTYELPFFTLGQSLGQQAGQPVGQLLGQSLGQPLSNTPNLGVVEDLKIEDLKTERLTTITNAGASACVNETPNDLDRFLAEWEKMRCARLNVEIISALEILLKRYGYDEMIATLKYCNRKQNSGVSLEYFERGLKLRQSQSPKSTLKGGERVGKVSGHIEYREPDTSWIP